MSIREFLGGDLTPLEHEDMPGLRPHRDDPGRSAFECPCKEYQTGLAHRQ